MGIKEEITKIAVEQGYEGAKPKSIAQAIDALTDTLAGEDVKSGRSVAGAIHALAPYIGSGGGGGFEPKGAWPISGEKKGDFYVAEIIVDSNDPTSESGESAHIYHNVLEVESHYANPGNVACGLYVTLFGQATSDGIAGKLTVARNSISGSEELPNVKREVSGTQFSLMFQVPEDAPAMMETLLVTALSGSDYH